MGRNIYLERTINILPSNILIVPGTEPSTTVTSSVLELEIRKSGRETPAIVDLNRALEVIPGSWVRLMNNFSSPIQKLFVLPPQSLDCDGRNIDYYEILRLAARPMNSEDQTVINSCSNVENYDQLMGS